MSPVLLVMCRFPAAAVAVLVMDVCTPGLGERCSLSCVSARCRCRCGAHVVQVPGALCAPKGCGFFVALVCVVRVLAVDRCHFAGNHMTFCGCCVRIYL